MNGSFETKWGGVSGKEGGEFIFVVFGVVIDGGVDDGGGGFGLCEFGKEGMLNSTCIWIIAVVVVTVVIFGGIVLMIHHGIEGFYLK